MAKSDKLNDKDKLLFNRILHYYEEERCNELVDAKNSQIIFTGAMLIMHATLFSGLLFEIIKLNFEKGLFLK